MIEEGICTKLDQLGKGGSGVIYSGLFEGKECAIKEFTKNYRDKNLDDIINEIDVNSALSHPNIVKMISYDPVGYDWICMERCQSKTLYDIIKLAGFIKQAYARIIVEEILNGISYMHCRGYAHRDIKPDNILFSHQYQPKISDLGFTTKVIHKTETDRYGGTRGYMAPEIYLKPEKIETEELFACDLFSLGVTIFNLLYGYQPFYDTKPSKNYPMSLAQNGLWDKFWNFHSRLVVTAEEREMVEGLLHPNPTKRWKWEDLQNCKWMQQPRVALDEYISFMQGLFENQ